MDSPIQYPTVQIKDRNYVAKATLGTLFRLEQGGYNLQKIQTMLGDAEKPIASLCTLASAILRDAETGETITLTPVEIADAFGSDIKSALEDFGKLSQVIVGAFSKVQPAPTPANEATPAPLDPTPTVQ